MELVSTKHKILFVSLVKTFFAMSIFLCFLEIVTKTNYLSYFFIWQLL